MSWAVELYREGARVPVEEFLNALDSHARDKVTAKIDLLGEMGTTLGVPCKTPAGQTLGTSSYRETTDSYLILHHNRAEDRITPCFCEKNPGSSSARD
jgi:hypothetical protein